jgi:four helix bundle protein
MDQTKTIMSSTINRYALEDRLVEYAVMMITISEKTGNSGAGKTLAGQLCRSGTSPALNYAEAQGAESKRDFLHKIKITLKELRESYVTLKILAHAQLVEKSPLDAALKESNELVSIFVKIAKTTEANLTMEKIKK